MSNQQIVSAILIDYAFRMGVDPRFVAIASATRPDDVHFFSNEELHLLRVNWNPKAFEPWAIETRGRGVVAFTASRDKTQTAVLFCRTDMVPRLFIKPDSKDIGWYKGALNALEGMSALGVAVPKNAVSLKIIEGGPALELALMGFEPNRINNEKRIGVGADGPRYMLSGFSFDLPKQNGVATTRVALKNCI
jgi:hypothetical protein